MPIDREFLEPGGALQGPLFQRLVARLGAEALPLPAGERFGAFEIVREIGRGGMAVVHLARRADGAYEQEVALKLLRPGGHPEAAEQLFLSERQILAGLQHPGIARLVDGGRTPDGRLWFAMDLVRGERIDRWCVRRNLDTHGRVALLRRVCAVVEFAHARSLIHRDIKPSNILVDEAGEPTLLDFGIARLLDDAAPGPGDRAHTAGYASPEQLRGEIVSTSSDVFQLGRLLATLLASGREPAAATTPTGVTPTSARASNEAPADLATIRDGDLRAIVAKATAAEPAARYATAAAFGADLDAWHAQRPVLARNGGVGYRFGRYARRHPFALGATVAVLLAFIATSAQFAWQLAVQRDRAVAEAAKSEQLNRFLVELFQVSDPSESRGDTLTANQILERGATRAERELAEQPLVKAGLLAAIGEVYMNLGQLTRAEAPLSESLALRSSAAPGSIDEVRALGLLALLRHRQARFDEAMALLDRAEALIVPQLPQPAWELVHAKQLSNRGMALKNLGRYDDARSAYERAIASLRRSGADEVSLAKAYNNLGLLEKELDHLPQAEALARQALAIYARLYGENHPLWYGAANNLGWILSEEKRFDEAQVLVERSMAVAKMVFGAESPDLATAINTYGNLLSDRGRKQESIVQYERAAAMWRRTLGEAHPYTGHALRNLGHRYDELGDPARAVDYYRQVLALWSHAYGAEHPQVAMAQSDLGHELGEIGAWDEARPLLEAALTTRLAKLPADSADTADTRMSLARNLRASGRGPEAAALYDAALRTYRAHAATDPEALRNAEALSRWQPPGRAGSTTKRP